MNIHYRLLFLSSLGLAFSLIFRMHSGNSPSRYRPRQLPWKHRVLLCSVPSVH